MARTTLIMCAIVLAVYSIGNSSTFRVDIDTGEVTIVKKSLMSATTVNSTASVEAGDSITIAADNQANIQLEDSSRLICKGPLNLMLSGENISLKVGIEGEGQVFLERKKPYNLGFIEIVTRGFTFRPIGTSAAVKTTRNGTPSTAVLEGKMNMQALNGEVVVVEQGSFGAVDQSGKLVSQKLSPRAIETLQKWVSSSPKRDKNGEKIGSSQSGTVQNPPSAQSSETAPVVENAQPATSAPVTTPVATPAPAQQAVAAQPANATAPSSQGASSVSTPAAPQQQAVKINAIESKQNVKPAEADSKKKPEKSQSVSSPAPAPNSTAPSEGEDQKASAEGDNAKKGDEKSDKSKPVWEVGAGVVTIDDQQWTRVNFGVDVPIWKFGIFFDLELFVDNNGNISNKGWDFKDEPLEAITRKIRYIRFGQENDPLFVKFGGLSSVTLGYGFLVDRFTNMLHYPDQKQLGLQFYLNDISPIGLTLQTVVADFKDFKDDGGVLGARLAVKPLKKSPIPIINGITIGGTYAVDLNQYAPARKWNYDLKGLKYDRDEDGITDGAYIDQLFELVNEPITSDQRNHLVQAGEYDTLIEHKDKWASRTTDQFGLIGGDIGIPLIKTSLVSLDLYGQAGMRDDGKQGWGTGAPGVALKVWQLWASAEYRHVQGRFTPGYFDMYYTDQRIIRDYPSQSSLNGSRISIKESRIPDDNLNGIFGKLGFNIANVLIIDGSYQYMIGKDRDNTDQRLEATSSIGDLIIQKLPKISKLEGYFQKTEIGNYVLKVDKNGTRHYDEFFDKTPFMYFGYRLGFKISEGASLIWDSRYGYKADKNGKMKENNFISVQTAVTF